jgi:hypothetical protein
MLTIIYSPISETKLNSLECGGLAPLWPTLFAGLRIFH